MRRWGQFSLALCEEEPGVCISSFDTESHYVAEAGLEFKIPLPQPLKGWDYGSTPSFLALHIPLKIKSMKRVGIPADELHQRS